MWGGLRRSQKVLTFISKGYEINQNTIDTINLSVKQENYCILKTSLTNEFNWTHLTLL